MDTNEQTPAYTNKLINETSPYLLQHAHNPVDWYAWGEEALSRAKAENKPILLSVGYSACHWCHVMAHESFENPEIAALMNQFYINIKVDREERPDIDAIYMEAVQSFTGQGGWPMTVFLTPDGAPFYGGTYFPPDNRHPRIPSFPQLLQAIHQTYIERPEEVVHNATEMKKALQGNLRSRLSKPEAALDTALLDEGLTTIVSSFDRRNGGLGNAPKFPQAMALDFVLRQAARTGDQSALSLLLLTLDKMANGGMYDQLGGGFHRYSVDSVWLVPHFEKMLYDNAQLALLYLNAWQATGIMFYQFVCTDILEYVLREMTSPEGGFYSAQDADSEGEEGKFFVWSKGEIEAVIGEKDARIFNAYYGVSERGNFEGHTILNVPRDAETVAADLNLTLEELQEALNRSREKLFEVREKRVHPGLDDKTLTSWNGLMAKAFAVAGSVLNVPEYLEAAKRNGEFVLSKLMKDGRLFHTYKQTERGSIAKLNGYLEDYSYYADALIALYEATFDLKWLDAANALAQVMVEQFWDEASQGFFDTSKDHEELLTRPVNLFDNAVPSGTSVAIDVLLKLALLTDDPQNIYRPKIQVFLENMGAIAAQHPTAFGRLASALDFYLGAPKEIVIVGDATDPATQALLATVHARYLPNKVLMLLSPDGETATYPLLQGRTQIDGKPTAYVCQNYACQRPVTTPEELAVLLGTSS